jgi:hypothetical protein
MVDMVEARTRIPGCKGLEVIEGKRSEWFNEAPQETQIRLFHALLPIAKELPYFHWQEAFEACFKETTSSPCEALDVSFAEDANLSSLCMLQAVPALEKLAIECGGRNTRR